MIAAVRQKHKAREKKELQINPKNIDIGPDTDEQGNINPTIVKHIDRIHEIRTNSETNNGVGNTTEAMKKAAIETLNITPSGGKL